MVTGRIPTPRKKSAMPRDNKAKRITDRILDETGVTTVSNIDFSAKEKCWIITYKNADLKPDRFTWLNELYEFLERG